MSFKSLGLSDALLSALNDKGYTEPSPIQSKAIPPILSKRDVLASAQTGTGKTAGFALPMIQILARDQVRRRPPIRGLVLTPTRELAAQVSTEIKAYSKFTELRSTVIFGGVKQGAQVASLEKGVDILVATPGRLLDLCNQGYVSLNQIEIFILDEADRMLDMGFLRDIKKVIGLMPDRRQNLMFSATFSKDIKKLANSILYNPVRVEATPENTTAELVNQRVIRVDQVKKIDLLIKLILDGNWHQVLVFTRTKHKANRVSQKLAKFKITSAPIHGNKTQSARTKALAGFKSGKISVLVATDIAARGLDIPLLPHVINFELPNVPEDYVHRIGRTGRAGSEGEALSLVSSDEINYMRDIEKLLDQRIETEIIEGFEPSKGPQPGGKKRNKQRQQGNQHRSNNHASSNESKDQDKSDSKKSSHRHKKGQYRGPRNKKKPHHRGQQNRSRRGNQKPSGGPDKS